MKKVKYILFGIKIVVVFFNDFFEFWTHFWIRISRRKIFKNIPHYRASKNLQIEKTKEVSEIIWTDDIAKKRKLHSNFFLKFSEL